MQNETNRLDLPSFTIGVFLIYPTPEGNWRTSVSGDAVTYNSIQDAVDIAVYERDHYEYQDYIPEGDDE